MSQWLTPHAQIGALAKAVSTAFSASSLTPEEMFPGQIEITDLPWATPPLRTSLKLGGIELQSYLDAPVRFEETKLFTFWRQTLDHMWNQPSRLIKNGALANCSWAMPRTPMQQRMLRFSTPSGWPGQMDELAGAQFTLELVHAVAISMPWAELRCDESNYWVMLPQGAVIGIQDGRILCDSPWAADVSGMVLDLLEMSRGATDYRCLFDQIASVRSVLHVHREKFKANFEALDLALQALRVLTTGQACPALLKVMRVAPIDMMVLREREDALRRALDVIGSPAITDRDKLRILSEILVPTVLSKVGYRRHIFAGHSFPFTMAAGKEDAIRQFLIESYEALPIELQREGVCNP